MKYDIRDVMMAWDDMSLYIYIHQHWELQTCVVVKKNRSVAAVPLRRAAAFERGSSVARECCVQWSSSGITVQLVCPPSTIRCVPVQ